MPLLNLVFELTATDAMALSDALLEAGALSVSAEDAQAGTDAEVPLYDEFDSALPDPAVWDVLRLRALVDADSDYRDLVRHACAAIDLAVPDFAVERVEDDDWVRRTQAQFTPIRISERLWIVPSWHVPPDPRAINIALDPGVAFGTGSHPTTRLCLDWLDRRLQGGETVLDYGCGSGILAIAAARLGATRVIGIDIDPAAVRAAQSNAEHNGVHVDFRDAKHGFADFDEADELFAADILVANILSNPLKVLAPALAARVRVGGRLALSGVLSPQSAEVRDAYAPWFDFETDNGDEGWVCLSGIRR